VQTTSDTSIITGDFVVRFEQIDGLRVAASLQVPTAPFGTFCPGQPMVVIKIAPLPWTQTNLFPPNRTIRAWDISLDAARTVNPVRYLPCLRS